MIEKVLEAYEAEIAKNSPLIVKLKKLNILMRCLLGFNILAAITICILPIFFQTIFVYLLEIAYYVVAELEIVILKRVQHKKWKKNITEYNMELDGIAKVLKRKDFDLYDKIKIKQLIRKFYQAIDIEEKKRTHKSGEFKDFIFTYIVPIVAFFAGKINTTFFSSEREWYVFGIVVIIMVVLIRYIYRSIIEIAGMISWNVLEKEKIFVPKLQDLLDRDFVIEQEDLLSIK